MAKLLFVCATEAEIQPLKSHMEASGLDAEILVTGVGMVNTAISVTRYLATSSKPDLVVNAGIAGSFSADFRIGDVVQIVQDEFSELGCEDGATFQAADIMGLITEDELRLSTDQRFNNLPTAKGITVNTVHGSTISIAEIMERLTPEVESMEGAAVAAVCQSFEIPWLQIRSVSNRVEQRDTSKWNIHLAIGNLNAELIKLLENRG